MLNASAAEAAAEQFLATYWDPKCAHDPTWIGGTRLAMKETFAAMFTAIYAGIVTSAVVVPSALAAPNGPVTGTASIT